MSCREDADYYWIRAAQELERAEQAASPAVAAVHHDLARRYGTLAAKSGLERPDGAPAEQELARPAGPGTARGNVRHLRSVGSRQPAPATAGGE